jgi:hypothetical protein
MPWLISVSLILALEWADLSPTERAQTEAGTLLLMRKHGWNIGGNHNMGSQAGAIVLQTLSDVEKQPDIKVKTMLGRMRSITT